MNTLSWLIYLADVAGGIGKAIGTMTFFACMVAIVSALTWIGTTYPPSIRPWDDKEKKLAAHEKFRRQVAGFIRPAVYVAIAGAVTVAIIPGPNTVYAIAASEVGERALKTDTANKAVQALNAWLDRQIDGGKGTSE